MAGEQKLLHLKPYISFKIHKRSACLLDQKTPSGNTGHKKREREGGRRDCHTPKGWAKKKPSSKCWLVIVDADLRSSKKKKLLFP